MKILPQVSGHLVKKVDSFILIRTGCLIYFLLIGMKLNEGLAKLLNRKYEPTSLIYLELKGEDIAIKTDKNGDAILAFMERKNKTEIIKANAM